MAQQGMLSNTALGRGIEGYVSDLNKVQQEFDTGNRNTLEYILGTGYAGVAKPIEEAVSYLLPDAIEQGIAKGAGAVAEATGLDQAMAYAQENYPDASRAFGEVTGLLGILSPTSAVKAAGQKAAIRRGAEDTRSPRERAEAAGVSSNFNVIIDNFYNPNAKVDGIYKIFSGDSKLAKAGRKVTGVLDWGIKGSSRVMKNMVNPVARARYIETGVAPVAIEGYKALLKLEERNKLATKRLDEELATLPKGDPRRKEIQSEKMQLASDVDNAIETLTSQLQQMGNIQAQAGSAPLKRNVPLEFVSRASREGAPVYATKAELGDNWFGTAAGDLGNVKPISSETSARLSDFIENQWAGSGLEIDRAKILVKEMQSKYTGDHWAVLSKNPQINAVERLFRPKSGVERRQGVRITDETAPRVDPELGEIGERKTGKKKLSVLGAGKTVETPGGGLGFYKFQKNETGELEIVPDVDSLRDALEQSAVKKNKDGTYSGDVDLIKTFAGDTPKNYRILGQDSDGVWITYSNAGRAKVEGGVNVVVRVDPDGSLTAIVSDLHDFGDKIPVLNTMLDNTLPSQVLAVTPPMQTNVQSISNLRSSASKDAELKAEYGENVAESIVPAPSKTSGLKKAQARETLDVLESSPSKTEVARQTGMLANQANFIGNVVAQEEE